MPLKLKITKPQSPLLWQGIDATIQPLVRVLNMPSWLTTFGSCSGHNKERANISLATSDVRKLVRLLNRIERQLEKLENEIWLDVSLTWSETIAVSCDFEDHPDWLMFDLAIGFHDEPTAPKDLALLAKIARKIIGAL